jgi:hypothetical protein
MPSKYTPKNKQVYEIWKLEAGRERGAFLYASHTNRLNADLEFEHLKKSQPAARFTLKRRFIPHTAPANQ